MNLDSIIAKINSLDPTYEFIEIYSLLQLLIDNGVPIKYIDNNCFKLPSYKIIDSLLRYGENNNNKNAIINYYDSLQINQDRCLVIADSHIGRLLPGEKYDPTKILENERGLYSAYNHALKQGISNAIHLGDLIEGDSERNQYRLPTQSCQLEYLERAYPKVNNVKTYLLYGNHDYNYIYHNHVDSKFYKASPNMELIGVNYSYINFCDNRIKLSHNCDKAEYFKNIELPYSFELSGHSHVYNVYEDYRLVRVPTISYANSCKSDIGFIEVMNDENEFLLKYYDLNGKEVKKNERVLSKNVKNTN